MKPVTTLACLLLSCVSPWLAPSANANSNVDTDISAVGVPQAHFNNADYRLGYEAYLGAGKLAAAYQVAKAAVHAAPNNLQWRKRLAQVSLWLNQPDVSLRNWLFIAKRNNSAEAWRAVGKLAPALDNHEALLQWREYQAKRHPSDVAILADLANAYEQIGLPDKGLVVLSRLKRKHPSIASYTAEMRLAMLIGDDALALKDFHWLNTHATPREDWLLQAAAIHYRHGRLAAAQQVLATAQANMPDSATAYWRTLAELSRLIGKPQQAANAYRKIYTSHAYKSSDLVNMAALMQAHEPELAAQISAEAFLQYGHVPSANTALYLWISRQQPDKARAFLARLTPAQLALLNGSAAFRLQRGQLAEVFGNWRLAMDNYAAGLAITPGNIYLIQAWVAVLLGHGQLQLLQQTLVEDASLAQKEPALWGLWAAGWTSLERTELALVWLQKRHLANPNNALFTLAYADALEQNGQLQAAQQLQRAILQQHHSISTDADDASELQRNLLMLALRHFPVDAKHARLNRLVAETRNQQGRVPVWVRELVLGAAWSDGATDSLPAHISHYLKTQPDTPPPVWSQLSLALNQHNRIRLAELLHQEGDLLPPADRVEAAEQLSRYDNAASHAFNAAELHPQNDALAQRWHERATEDSSHVQLSFAQQQQGKLVRLPARLDWQGRLDGNHFVSVYAEQARLQGLDGILQLPLTQQKQVGAGLTGKFEYTQWSLWATQLDSLTRSNGAKAKLEWTPAASFSADLSMGWRQFNDITSLLSMLSTQDYLAASLGYSLTGRDSLSLASQLSRINAQGNGRLGTFRLNTLGYSHRLFAGASDWLVKTSMTHAASTVATRLPDQLAPLLPAGTPADPAFLVPADYTQYSMALAFGETAEQQHLRGWHSFGEVGIMYDTNAGTGYRYRFGLIGALLGGDRLRLYTDGTAGKQSRGETNLTLGLEYRYYY